MNKVKYLLRVFSGMRFKSLKDALDKCYEKSGKSRFLMFFDMLWCAARYGAGYNDYLIFGFYDMTGPQRDTYVTRVRNKKLISRLNDDSKSYLFDDKNVFAQLFAAFFKRDFLDMRTVTLGSLEAFIKGKEYFFAKPNNGVSGKGIEKLAPADFETTESLYNYLADPEKDFGLLEEGLTQHEAINRLYPLSINTLRIVTLVDDAGQAHVIYTTLKMGDGGRFVDNLESGGMCVPVDPQTGRLVGVAHTSRLAVLDKHPWTGIVFDGYEVPYIAEAHEMCRQAALVVPDIRFSGWDICITPDGPAMVEGNDYPGYDFWQLPEQTPDKTGLWPLYKEMVPGL